MIECKYVLDKINVNEDLYGWGKYYVYIFFWG